MIITELAPAKINLGLKILRKRPDGYHDILSLFQTVALYDELGLSDRGSGLECDCPGLSAGPDNLVLRAERAFREATGFKRPARFSLRKRIPVGAGLGGGSSDAAAALRGLARLSGEPEASQSLLLECAAKIGSDVPFLLTGGTAIVEGRGERMEPVSWPFDFTYALIYPGFGISTAWAYSRVGEYAGDGGIYRQAMERLKDGSLNKEMFLEAISNDFEKAVFPERPILIQIKENMCECGAISAFLTGSGSTMAGIFEDPETALRCAEEFRAREFEAYVAKKTA